MSGSIGSAVTGQDLVATVERLYELERRKQLHEWAALWADDARVLFPLAAEREKHEIHGKAAVVATTAKKFAHRERIEIGLRVEPMADGRRVVAHLDVTIRFVSGPVLSVPLLVILTFNEAGLITTMEEYVNEAFLATAEDWTP